MSTLDESVGTVLRNLRQLRGMTQAELGYRTNLDPVTISRIERGVRAPSLGSLFALAKALNINAEEMIRQIAELQPQIQTQEDAPAVPYRKKGKAKGS